MRFMIIVKATADTEAGVMPEEGMVGPGRDAEIEVRQLFELEDFEDGEAIQRFRQLGTV